MGRVSRSSDWSPTDSQERMGQQVGGRVSQAAGSTSSPSSPAQLNLEVGQLCWLLSPEPRDSDETKMRHLLDHGRHSGEAAYQHLPAHSAHAEDSCKERERLEEGRARRICEGRQSEKYGQQSERVISYQLCLREYEVKLTHLSQLIRNRTETTPSQETTHIRWDIFLYQVNQD